MKISTAPAACRIFLLSILAAAQAATAEQPDPRQVWSAGSGSMELEIRGDYLPDFGIEILHNGEPITTRKRISFPLSEIEPMQLHAPWGNLEELQRDTGKLAARTGLSFRRLGREVSLDRISLLPAEGKGHPQFVAVDPAGNELFRLTHMHMLAHPEDALLSVANAEVEASPYLAKRLQLDALDGMPIALGWLELNMTVPAGADTSGTGPGCTERPIWPQDGQFEADVSLIDIGTVAYQGTEPGTGLLKIAPSATLRNEALADIPWIGHFSSHPDYPFDPADQHPFLVWNIYRIANGRIQMLSASGVKHAFLTLNFNCDINCGDGNILWPGCEDTYSSGNNDTSTYQGPRDEIEASLGLWDNCGSFFDPECTGSWQQGAGQWLHRLLIDPAHFDTRGDFFLDAWYVIQYDNNIWNGMGYRPIDPTPSGGGWTMNPGAYSQGPVISEWVAEDEQDPMADHAVITVPSETPGAPYPGNMPQGHMRLLVKVSESAPGRYRYNYALQNYDFDRAMEGFRIDLPEGVTVHDTWFGDVDGDAGNDWNITVNSDHVLFEAPAGNPLGWFTLFNFEIEVDAEPVDSEVVLDLGDDASLPEMSVSTLGPAAIMGLLFRDRFEATASN